MSMKKVLVLLFIVLISSVAFSQENEVLSEDVVALKSNNLDGFKVYPNPTRNTLTVNIGTLSNGLTFRINDVLGKLVYIRKMASYDLQNDSFKIDMSSFKDGIYMFSLETKTTSKAIKVVKL